jgi:hypothetical protein
MISKEKILVVVLLTILAVLLFSTTVLADSGTPSGSTQQTTSTPQRVETYGIGWGTLMLINAGLAQGKNRKGLNWFLISLVLGPIATFVLVAFFPKLPATQP